MGKKLKLGILAVVGVLGLAAFAPAAKADEGWRGGDRGRVERTVRVAHFDRDRFERNRDWRFNRFERRPGVYYRNGWGYRPYFNR